MQKLYFQHKITTLEMSSSAHFLTSFFFLKKGKKEIIVSQAALQQRGETGVCGEHMLRVMRAATC